MALKRLLSYVWKLPLCALAFLIGMIAGGIILPLLGLQAPAMPAGTDANTIMLYFLLGSLILAVALSFLSQGLDDGWAIRALVLGLFSWAWNSVGMVLEAGVFMTTGAASSGGAMLFTMLNMLLPSLTLAGMVALLFRPDPAQASQAPGLRGLLTMRPGRESVWRFAAAIVAFPAIYIACGLLVRPFIEGYYASGAYELASPTWGQIIPLQLARSVLFLLASLPIVAAWRDPSRSLALPLGLAIWVLVAFTAVITAYWFPWQMRLFHGLELA
ncbi:MAG TPA: hypothetical protein PLB78_15105, partial [Anaerolineae bacterium]|nr:hypothetical protein [Anaerolineae bacterium]